MPWISWGKNQIFTAKSMLKLFSLVKRFLKEGPEGWPHGRSGGDHPQGGQKLCPPLEIGLIRACIRFFTIEL